MGKLSATGQQQLQQDDPFFLEFKDANALTTVRALLRVHQLEAGKELVWFRVVTFQGNEMAHIDALAEKQEVPGKGYSARPVCDLTQYANQNLGNTPAALRQLAAELAAERL